MTLIVWTILLRYHRRLQSRYECKNSNRITDKCQPYKISTKFPFLVYCTLSEGKKGMTIPKRHDILLGVRLK